MNLRCAFSWFKQFGLKSQPDEMLMRVTIWLTLLLCVAFSIIIACPLIPLGVIGEWVFERKFTPLANCIPMAVVAVVLVLIAWRFIASPPKSIGYSICAHALIFITIVLLKLASQIAEPPNRNPIASAAYIAVSPIATSYFTAAREAEHEGWLNVLRSYDEFMRRQPVHAATHPPGMLMLYSLIRIATRSSDWLQHVAYGLLGGGWRMYDHIYIVRRLLGVSVEPWELAAAFLSSLLMLLLGALALPPVVFGALLLVRCANGSSVGDGGSSCDSANRAWFAIASAVLLYSLSPAQLAFSLSPDQLLTLVSALGTICLCAWMVKPKQKFALSLCGVLGFIGTICSFKFLPIIAAWAIWVVGASRCAAPDANRGKVAMAVKSFFWLIIPMVLLPLLFSAAFKFDWLGAFSAAMRAHGEQAASSVRTHWKWAIVNLIEFGISIGPALVALLKVCSFRLLIRGGFMALMPSLSSIAVIILLDLLGVVRGEVSRVWLPFVPMLAVGTAANLAQWELSCRDKPLILLSALQCIVALLVRAMVDSVRPW